MKKYITKTIGILEQEKINTIADVSKKFVEIIEKVNPALHYFSNVNREFFPNYFEYNYSKEQNYFYFQFRNDNAYETTIAVLGNGHITTRNAYKVYLPVLDVEFLNILEEMVYYMKPFRDKLIEFISDVTEEFVGCDSLASDIYDKFTILDEDTLFKQIVETTNRIDCLASDEIADDIIKLMATKGHVLPY